MKHLDWRASRLTLHKQGVTAGEAGRERVDEEARREEGDKRRSPVKRAHQEGIKSESLGRKIKHS